MMLSKKLGLSRSEWLLGSIKTLFVTLMPFKICLSTREVPLKASFGICRTILGISEVEHHKSQYHGS